MAATMEANHGLLQGVLARSTVLQELANANKFNIDAPRAVGRISKASSAALGNPLNA